MKEDKELKQFAESISGMDKLKDIIFCSKCGNELPDTWEQRACGISIEINIDCCSSDTLWGYDNNISFSHPSIQEGSGEQRIKIKTGNKSEYNLCIDCHKQFISTIGNWIKDDSN